MLRLKSIIDEGFYPGKYLADFAKKLFDLDDEALIIFGLIAEHGPINEFKIKKMRIKKDDKVTREMVASRLKNGVDKKFLKTKKVFVKPNGKKQIPLYHLTLKGLIASLWFTPFEENYLVKDFKKHLEKKFDVCDIPEIAIHAIRYNLGSFMVNNVIVRTKLTDINNLDAYIYRLNNSPAVREIPLQDNTAEGKKILKIQEEMIVRSYTVQKTLNQAFEEAHFRLGRKKLSEKAFPGESYGVIISKLDEVRDDIKHWSMLIEDPQILNFNKFTASELSERDGRMDMVSINHKANYILNELGIKSKIKDDYDEKLFFEKFHLNRYSLSH